MKHPLDQPIKRFYENYHDQILAKRHNSPFWIRRYAHRAIHQQIVRHIAPGETVLDTGCGEGLLTTLAGQKGTAAVGLDLSMPNVQSARILAGSRNIAVPFLVGDAEHLPFADDSFDTVVSSHVLEHLPDWRRGLQELRRVARRKVILAMPTCLTPAAWALLGGDSYWVISRRSLWAIPLGLVRTARAFVARAEGPDEHYAGQEGLPHVWRFPWVITRSIAAGGLRLVGVEAGPLVIPYLPQYFLALRRLQKFADRFGRAPLLRYLGYGMLFVCAKVRE